MYTMENLLILMHNEKARSMRIQPGRPPMITVNNRSFFLESPPVTREIADHLLRSVANSREMRKLRESGRVTLIYTLPGISQFLVNAKTEGENLELEIM